MLLARILKQFLGVLVAVLGGWLAGILFAFAWAAVDVTTHHGEVPAIALFVLPWIVALGSAGLYLSRSACLGPAFFAVMALAHLQKFGRTGWRVHCFRIPFAASAITAKNAGRRNTAGPRQ